MQRKNVAFEQLSDVMAFRILVEDIGDCYHALGIIHSAYHVVPGRFKDYVSTPKPNNYRSLHTGVIGPEQQRIEVQIRTREMHETADLGVAAHWAYTRDGRRSKKRADEEWNAWVRSLMDLNRMVPSSMSFCPARRRSRFLTAGPSEVFCGSRKRSCAALATLLTFWPPGPEERMNFHSNSSSGMTRSGAMIRLIAQRCAR